MRLRRVTSVRGRTTLGATVVVGLALLVGAFGLLGLLHSQLIADLDEITEVRAFDVAALSSRGDLPPVLGTFGDEPAYVQVVDPDGRVVASTDNVTGKPPLARFAPAADHGSSRTFGDLDIPGGDFRVRALTAPSPGGDLVVYAGIALLPIEESTAKVRRLLMLGLPPLVMLVALTAWVGTGRSLRPVEAIRAEVARISERDLDRRVPVPPTGDEVARLAVTMNGMLDRVEAAAVTQRRFVADASHELQTPLASIRTDLEVALTHPGATDWPVTAADVLEQNRRMERLVQDLLYLARVDEGPRRAPPAPVDLDDVTLAEAARLASYGRIQVDVSQVRPAAVLGRRDDLGRVVRNLLDNAERYAASTARLELGEDEAAGWVTLAVTDDGPGIPPEQRHVVFTRFTRLEEARTRDGGGTGLGLAIVHEIVTAHGGTVAVADSPGGARLVVRLPACP